MENKPLDTIGYTLILIFTILLSYCGYIAYQSIDWTVLTRLESQKLVLPTPLLVPSATALSPTPALTPATK